MSQANPNSNEAASTASFVLNVETGEFIPAQNYRNSNNQLQAPPGYSFVSANVVSTPQNTLNTFGYLQLQQQIYYQHQQAQLLQQQHTNQMHRNQLQAHSPQPQPQMTNFNCSSPAGSPPLPSPSNFSSQFGYSTKSSQQSSSQQSEQQDQYNLPFEEEAANKVFRLNNVNNNFTYHQQRDGFFNDHYVDVAKIIDNNPELKNLSLLGAIDEVSYKSTTYNALKNPQKDLIKGRLVLQTHCALRNIFRNVGCLVDQVEGNGYVASFKVYRYRDLHYCVPMFDLVAENIKVKEISLEVQMSPGRFYRYGIQIELVVNKSDIEPVAEALQILKLRPVFVKGQAFQEPISQSLACLSIEELSDISASRTNSNSNSNDLNKLERTDSDSKQDSSDNEENDSDQIQIQPLDDGRPPLCGQLFKKSKSYPTKYENLALEQGTNSFSRLSIQVGDEAPIILDLQLGDQEQVKVTQESLNILKRSVTDTNSSLLSQNSITILKKNVSDTSIKSISRHSAPAILNPNMGKKISDHTTSGSSRSREI